MRVEICVDSVAGALAAERGGADRVELCANLKEGGTTPSAGCIRHLRRVLKNGMQVIIRPRGGDFLFDTTEMETMKEDIRIAKEIGANGVVIGCLTADGDIDRSRTEELIGLARPMSVTFHRAFDMCRDPRTALETLLDLGVNRILTSGQKACCAEGVELIAELQRLAKNRIVIMPGGGINAGNVRQIVEATGVEEVHLSASKTVNSQMRFRNPDCFMGSAPRDSEFTWRGTDEEAVRQVVNCLRTVRVRV